MDAKEFPDHLKNHNIQETKGTRTMLTHMDAKDWFSSSYEWIIGGFKFVQYTVNVFDLTTANRFS